MPARLSVIPALQYKDAKAWTLGTYDPVAEAP
jgi:hypothetical protein